MERITQIKRTQKEHFNDLCLGRSGFHTIDFDYKSKRMTCT